MHRFALFLLPALVAACGGRTLDDEFGNPGGGSTTETDSATTATDTARGSEDAFVEEDVFFGEDASEPDVAPVFDTATPPPTDTGPPAKPPIKCGMTSCDPKTQQCCVQPSGGGATSSCRSIGGCGDRALALSCTSPAGCSPGQVCCLRISMSSSATCATSCGGGGESYRLCANDAECRMGERCRGTSVGIRVCLPGGGGGGGGGGGP